MAAAGSRVISCRSGTTTTAGGTRIVAAGGAGIVAAGGAGIVAAGGVGVVAAGSKGIVAGTEGATGANPGTTDGFAKANPEISAAAGARADKADVDDGADPPETGDPAAAEGGLSPRGLICGATGPAVLGEAADDKTDGGGAVDEGGIAERAPRGSNGSEVGNPRGAGFASAGTTDTAGGVERFSAGGRGAIAEADPVAAGATGSG